MLGYFLLILGIILSSILFKGNKQLLFMFIAIAIFSSIRYGIGYDYYSYLEECSGLKHNENNELIPYLMQELSKETIPFLFFFLSSFFISFFYYLGIKKTGVDYLLCTMFYIAFPFLFMNQLGVIRQGMATAVVFCVIAMHNEKLYKRIILLVIACLCHQSALIGFVVLFPWHKIPLGVLWGMVLAGSLLGTLLLPLLNNFINLGFLSEIGTEKAINYLGNESSGEGRFIQLLIYVIGFFVLVKYKKIIHYNSNNKYYIGLLIFGVILFAMFSFNISLAKRLSMFFFSSAIIIMPYLVKSFRVSRAFFVAICLALFAMTIYAGSGNIRDEDSPGYSVTYPYRTIFHLL